MLEWIISSTVLVLIVIALRFILKGKISLRLQYALWAIVLLRLIIPVNFGTSSLSVMNAVENSEPYSSVIASLDASELPYGTLKDTALSQNEAEDTHGGTVYKIQGHSVESGKSDLHTYFFKAPARTVINKVLSVLWLSGTATTALCFIFSNAVFFIRLRKSRVFVETALPQLPVYVTEAVDTPCLFGYFHPAIYITPGSCGDETRMRHIIAHELTHYRHFDHIWSLLRGICLALHWYNPLVWQAAVLSRNDAELACDEATIRRIGENERAEYGRTLIEMTCQKRPALLLTATTMTGSANSIKERITMIAKKPKTAIYTLIAVILIVAVAAGCAFTGAKKDSIDYTDEWFATEAWTWAEEYAAENGLSIAKNNYTVFRYTDDKSVDVVFLESNGARSVQVAFKQNEDGTWAVIPANAVNLIERDRWGIQISVSDEIINNVPAAVLDYAQDYVAQEVDSWNNGNFEDGIAVQHINKVTEAKITGITQINTGTAALDYSINMYLLEYRLLPEDQDNIVLAGGMRSEMTDGQSWLTEWGSTGQPYLLLLAEDDNWTRICVTNTDSIDFDYGTPEMLEQYGDKYTAAAMELYKETENGGTFSPVDSIDSLFASGDVALTLNLANDGAYNTYPANEWYSGRFKVLLSGYIWTELEMPLTEPSDFWLTAASADGAKSMTFWANSGAGMVQYNDGNITTYWSASPANEYSKSIAEDVRHEYDNLDVDYSRIVFYFDGSAEAAADSFVHSAYGSHMMSLAPENMYGMSEYDVVQWEVREISENGDAVVGWFECAFTPWDFYSIGIWAGNTTEGTGAYEGKLTFYREFVLQRQENGYWHCIGLGTGGYSLPE